MSELKPGGEEIPHTTKEGWEERFIKRFTVPGGARALSKTTPWMFATPAKEAIAFIASEIKKAQVEVLDEVAGEVDKEVAELKPYTGSGADKSDYQEYGERSGLYRAGEIIRARITSKQSEV